MSRTTLTVRRDLAAMLSEEARKHGKPVFALANEIIEWYLWAKHHGFELSEALTCYEAFRAAKSIGMTSIPLEFFELILKTSHICNDKKAIESWRLSGFKLGRFFASMNKDIFSSLRIVDMMLMNLVEIRVMESKGEVIVTILGPKLEMDVKEFIDAYFCGIFSGLHYSVIKKDVVKGLHIYKLRKS